MIEVRMGVNDADHFQAQGIEASQDQVMIATGSTTMAFFVTGSPR